MLQYEHYFMKILKCVWVSMSDISLLLKLTCWIFQGFTMRMRLFLIFHLERCFEEFQHRTAYFTKTDLLFSLDSYFGYTRLCSCSANEKWADFIQFLTLESVSEHYPWTMWPRKRICFAKFKFDVWLLSYQNIKLHSSSISRTGLLCMKIPMNKRVHGDNKKNVEHVRNYLST